MTVPQKLSEKPLSERVADAIFSESGDMSISSEVEALERRVAAAEALLNMVQTFLPTVCQSSDYMKRVTPEQLRELLYEYYGFMENKAKEAEARAQDRQEANEKLKELNMEIAYQLGKSEKKLREAEGRLAEAETQRTAAEKLTDVEWWDIARTYYTKSENPSVDEISVKLLSFRAALYPNSPTAEIEEIRKFCAALGGGEAKTEEEEKNAV